MKIKLKVDLPIDQKHGCKAGNVYETVKNPDSRLTSFIAESGELVCAYGREYEVLEYDK